MKLLLVISVGLVLGAIGVQALPTVINVPVNASAPPLAQAAPEHIFWDNAVHAAGFSLLSNRLAPQWNTTVAVAATPEAVYFQIAAMMPEGTSPKADERQRDGRLWLDDCVEIAMALPGDPPNEYKQFSINAANTVYDAYRVDSAWNGSWSSTAQVHADHWLVTVKIPFSDLDLTEPPERLYCNIGRTTIVPEAEQSVWVRSHPELFFGNLAEAVILHFQKGLPTATITPLAGDAGVGVRARALALPEEKFADFTLTAHDAAGNPVASADGQSRFDSLQSDLVLPPLPDGNFRLEFTMKQATQYQIPAYYGGGVEANPALADGGTPQIYMRTDWPVTVDNAPDLRFDIKLKEAGAVLQAQVTPRSIWCSDRTVYRFGILDEAGKAVLELGEYPYTGEPLELSAAIATLPERGRFALQGELIDGGEVVVRSRAPFATPPRPVWRTDNPDRPDAAKVPAPWREVELDGMTVSCWNRRYEFAADRIVPRQITSGGVPLLTAPAAVKSSPAIAWELIRAEKRDPGCVRFDYRGRTADGMEVKAFSEVYYDGVIRTDLTLPPGASFSQLALEVPVRRETARFIHHGPVIFGGIFTTRELGNAEHHAIVPNYMLLNDDVGVGWFDAMPFNWPLAQTDRAIELVPEKDRALLRVNYLDHAGTAAKERTFSWGLQSFPARPLPEIEEAMRLCYVVRYGDEDKTAWLSTVDYPAQGNVNVDAGSLELKIQLPAGAEAEPFLRIAHGENYVVELAHDGAGGVSARELVYGAAIWHLEAAEVLTPEQWHSVALNWGDRLALLVDGLPAAELAHGKLMRVEPTLISAGGANIRLDELHISAVERDSFAVEAEPVPDEKSLLYDNFDRTGYVNGRRATLPVKISVEAEAGYLLPDTNLAPGVRGRAVGPLTARRKNRLEGYAELGFQAVCYHASQYTDEAFAGLYIADEARFKRSLAAVHAAGMKGILYAGNSLSTFDRSWDAYADEWLIEPRGVPFIQSWIPDEKGYQACPRSGYIDYFMYRIGKLLDDYGADGIFLDGRMESECKNRLHGCGVENFDGEWVAERDVWDGLYKQRFLYNVIENRNAYGEQHKSGNWNIPNCFYWDGVWEGEQLMGVQLNGRKRLEVFPLAAMRAQINGIPFGMPSRNTAYAYAPFTPVENCTISFVHGTTWTMTYRMEEGHVVAPYWKALEAFGAGKRNFRPYWSERPPAGRVCDDMIKVSGYVKPKEALILVANFNEDRERVTGTVTLNLESLGIGKPVLRDAFSHEAVAITPDGSFQIDLKSFRQAWYLVSEEEE